MTGVVTGGVRLSLGARVARIVLKRPPLNILDLRALEALEDALADAAGSEEAALLLLTGEGRAFCAGVDVADHLPDRAAETIARFGRIVERLLRFPLPVVAAVNGPALGGGCELVTGCDLVLARADATLGQPEVRLGVFPPAAASLLPRLLGRQQALDLILSGRTLSAEDALRVGLVQRVFPVETFSEDVEALLDALGRLSRPVLRLAKRAVLAGLDSRLEDAMRGAEELYLTELMALHDPVEGLEAFLERREPVWKDG